MVTEYVFDQRHFVLTMDPLATAAVTISVPHDTLKSQDLSGIMPTRDCNVPATEGGVGAIAKDIAMATPVQVVRGLMWRGVCDYNCKQADAYDHPSIERFWLAYREAIRVRLSESTRVFRPLLLDLHGFGDGPANGDHDLILGTGNRTTVSSDVDLKLGMYLRRRGYKVFVPKQTTVVLGRSDRFNGGDIVRWAADETGADAIQIEIAQWFRTRAGVEKGKKLSRDLASFIAKYTWV